MEYHAMIEKSEGWWIGRLIEIPGVNAQENTQEELLESLRTCAEDMLELQGIRDPDVEIVIPSPPRSGTGRSDTQDRTVVVPEELER